jgi:hypothetical protein
MAALRELNAAAIFLEIATSFVEDRAVMPSLRPSGA